MNEARTSVGFEFLVLKKAVGEDACVLPITVLDIEQKHF